LHDRSHQQTTVFLPRKQKDQTICPIVQSTRIGVDCSNVDCETRIRRTGNSNEKDLNFHFYLFTITTMNDHGQVALRPRSEPVVPGLPVCLTANPFSPEPPNLRTGLLQCNSVEGVLGEIRKMLRGALSQAVNSLFIFFIFSIRLFVLVTVIPFHLSLLDLICLPDTCPAPTRLHTPASTQPQPRLTWSLKGFFFHLPHLKKRHRPQ
jgi:hypothetical protein